MSRLNQITQHINVGILTFHYAVNPGSTLQAYGLLKTINALSPSIECHIINYQESNYRKLFLSFNPKWSVLGNVIQLYNIFSYIRFQFFWCKMGGVRPKRRINEKQLQRISGYDTIVVGSDQVWNLKLTNRNLNFFIPFIKGTRKISYAASIGMDDFPDEDKVIVTEYLKDFKFLSVREPEAQLAIERLIGRSPELVVDPSLLLLKSDYELIAQKPKIRRSYIFLYLRHKDSEVVPYARKMAKKLGVQIVECHGGARKIFSDDQIVIQPGPREWLGWIMNAEYVFTDSFHGCAFCINCNKQFFVKISSANSEMQSRIFNILDKYDMRDRLIQNEDDMFSKQDINFSKSNDLLVQDRKKALKYLETALGIK